MRQSSKSYMKPGRLCIDTAAAEFVIKGMLYQLKITLIQNPLCIRQVLQSMYRGSRV